MRRSHAAGAAAIVALLLGIAYVVQRPSPPSDQPSAQPETDKEVVAFSADGWLWSYQPTSARRIVRVDAPADPPPAFGAYVAVTAHGKLVVLSPRAGGAIAVVNLARRRVSARARLPRRVTGRAILVGPRTRRLYVVARRGRPGRTRFGGTRSDALLLIRAPDPRRGLASGLIRRSAGHDWDAFAAAISPNEELLALSYHGDDTTGVDLVDTQRSTRATCPRAMTPDRACIPAAHGDVGFADGGLVAASGTEPLLEISLGGAIRRRDTRLVDSHATALLLSPTGKVAYALAECGYVGGLSRIELRSGAVTLLAKPRQSTVCGSEMTLLADGNTMVAAGSSGPAAGRSSRLQWIDLATGRIEAEQTARSAVLGLASLP